MNEPEKIGKDRFKHIGASHLLLVKSNKLLMLRRCNTGYQDGNYSVVAGHIDDDESARECMAREAREEVGIDISAEDLEVVHVMHRSEVENRIDFFFKADKWEGDPVNMEPHKCDDLLWTSLDELPENTVPYIRDAVECFKNKINYSERGWK